MHKNIICTSGQRGCSVVTKKKMKEGEYAKKITENHETFIKNKFYVL